MIGMQGRARSFALAACAALAACGSSPKSSTEATTVSGRLIDSAVGGIHYTSGAVSGTTEADGAFTYEEGQPVVFTLGGITFGSVTGKTIVTPVDLAGAGGAAPEADPRVLRITQFLLMIDADGDPANGIAIPPAADAAAAGRTVDFATATDASLVELVTSLAGAAPTFVSTTAALSHVRDSILGLYAGSWDGTYGRGGATLGTWQLTIGIGGAITGTTRDASDGDGVLTGQLRADGSLELDASDGTTVAGRVDPGAGSFSGTLSRGSEQGWFRGGRSGVAEAGAPRFTPAAGHFDAAVSVTITSSTPGASIRYTVDGSLPTPTHGTVYTGPVNVAASTTLLAVAYAVGTHPSSVTSGSYTIGGGGALTCPAAANPAPVITSENRTSAYPAPAGGTLVDGTYHRTQTIFYEQPAAGPGSDHYQGIVVVSGNTVQLIDHNTDDPETRGAATWTASGTNLVVTLVCPAAGTQAWPYTATATGTPTLKVYEPGKKKESVYTRVGPPTAL